MQDVTKITYASYIKGALRVAEDEGKRYAARGKILKAKAAWKEADKLRESWLRIYDAA